MFVNNKKINVTTMKKLPHEIALARIGKALRLLDVEVRDVVEKIPDDYSSSAQVMAEWHHLEFGIDGYETARIMASYVCIDATEWTYSESELDDIGIVAHQEIVADVEPNMEKEAKERFDEFRVSQAAIISAIKGLGYPRTRLHFTFSVRLPSGQIRSYSVHKDV